MSQLPLFDDPPDLAPQAARLAPRLRELADRGVYFGTSSWKYEGWLGSVYSTDRYLTRGKLSKKKFETDCLTEYAQVFPTVCGDFAFYQFPTDDYWAKLFGALPDGFFVSLKVPEDITVARWPKHARYGTRAGSNNEHFLDADLLRRLFLRRLEPYRERLGSLILEFGTFAKSDFPTPDAFREVLGGFLDDVPGGFRFSVEIRNAEYLSPAYFDTLARNNVAHVYNAWTRMPELTEQFAIEESDTADFTVARALLRKGRSYEQAVASFEPYERTREVNENARRGLCDLARRALFKKKPAYLFINNRLEGNAPSTIEAVAAMLDE